MLLDAAVDFEVNLNQTEAQFLRWWNLNAHKLTVDLPDDLDAVRMMTIHRAKGLEFPIVILAFADWRAFSELKSEVWIRLPEEDYFGLPVAKVSLSKDVAEIEGNEAYSALYRKNQDDVVLDNLNLLYVALTRAVDRLHIFGASDWEDNQRITAYLQYYLATQDAEDVLFWSVGEKTPKSLVSEKEEKDNPHHSYASSLRQEKLAVAIESPKNWHSKEPAAASWGNKVHSVLAKLPNKADAAIVLEKMTEDGVLAHEEYDELYQTLNKILEHPELSSYFSENVEAINEGEILLPNSGGIRADRMVREGNRIHILDYKTGKPHPHHKNQVDGYAQIIGEMGFIVGDKVLVYLQDDIHVQKW